MHDVIIIGGGPAGLTAGMYNARARLDVVLIERLAPGGQVLTTDWVENYPGFPDGISGFELMDKMKSQAEKFGLVIRNEEAMGLELSDDKKTVKTNNIVAPELLLQSTPYSNFSSLFQIFFLSQDQSQNVEVVETEEIDFWEIIDRLNVGESVFIKNKNTETLESRPNRNKAKAQKLGHFTHC